MRFDRISQISPNLKKPIVEFYPKDKTELVQYWINELSKMNGTSWCGEEGTVRGRITNLIPPLSKTEALQWTEILEKFIPEDNYILTWPLNLPEEYSFPTSRPRMA